MNHLVNRDIACFDRNIRRGGRSAAVIRARDPRSREEGYARDQIGLRVCTAAVVYNPEPDWVTHNDATLQFGRASGGIRTRRQRRKDA